MQLEMTGRHVQIDDELRTYAEEKLRRLTRILDEPMEVHIVLGAEKHRHSAEIHVRSGHAFLAGHGETADPHAAISEVVEKLERQARRYKERLTDHKRRKGPRNVEAAVAIQANASPTAAQATPDGASGAPAPRIVPGPAFQPRPMSPEDAALRLDETGESLIVFRDIDGGRISVLHRTDDGNFALVETDEA